MEVLQAILLGLLQGLTEFLPVSSSGHLLIFKKLFEVDTNVFGLYFDIALHVATLIAVFVVLWKDILSLIRKPFQKLMLMLVVATIPAVIVGVLFQSKIEEVCETGGYLGISFIITAIVIWMADTYAFSNKGKNLDDITYKNAGLIGISQAIAILPGISRSGSTLSTGMLTGLKKDAAVRFAFLMSIPVILGSAGLGIKDIAVSTEPVQWLPLIAGMIAAAVAGYISITFMINFLKKRSMKVFSVYVLIIGTLILTDQLFFQRFFTYFMSTKM